MALGVGVLAHDLGARAQPAGQQVVYAVGWNLVSGPPGSNFSGAQSPLYTLPPGNSSYETITPDQALHAGYGYWAYFNAGAAVRLSAGDLAPVSITIPAGQYVMLGNPSGVQPATVSGADVVFTYDPVQGYQSVFVLQPGQGAWAFSFGGAMLTIAPAAGVAPTPVIQLTASSAPSSVPAVAVLPSRYPLHPNITATVFWVGEPAIEGSSENNAISAWDDAWQEHYGGYDDYQHRNGWFPAKFTPKENPFYFDVPYNDFNDKGDRKPQSYQVVPWANERQWGPHESMLKNRWVRITKNNKTVYAQWEDAGPYEYNDAAYVFGTAQPHNKQANSAGMDVSPAVRDYLAFNGLNNAENRIDWQFVDTAQVPDGPWKQIITTSQIFWR
ncbi:MAG: hypothetical protein ACR2GA_06760 [Chloroflexota bacterium]